jgi:hypothetical protein
MVWWWWFNVFISSSLKSLIKFRLKPRHKAPNSTVTKDLLSICTVTLFNHAILNSRDVACVETEVCVCDLSRFYEQILSLSGTTIVAYDIIYYCIFVPLVNHQVERPSVFAATFVSLVNRCFCAFVRLHVISGEENRSSPLFMSPW